MQGTFLFRILTNRKVHSADNFETVTPARVQSALMQPTNGSLFWIDHRRGRPSFNTAHRHTAACSTNIVTISGPSSVSFTYLPSLWQGRHAWPCPVGIYSEQAFTTYSHKVVRQQLACPGRQIITVSPTYHESGRYPPAPKTSGWIYSNDDHRGTTTRSQEI